MFMGTIFLNTNLLDFISYLSNSEFMTAQIARYWSQMVST